MKMRVRPCAQGAPGDFGGQFCICVVGQGGSEKGRLDYKSGREDPHLELGAQAPNANEAGLIFLRGN